MVVSVLGTADDDDHRGIGPVLRGAPQVSGLHVGADLVGQLAGCVVEALQYLCRGTAAYVAAGEEGREVRDIDDLHAAGPVVQETGGRVEGAQRRG
jgi:hypothetical protein